MIVFMNQIAERLREFRLYKSDNQDEVARIAGMSQAAWAGWEKQPPKALQSLVDIAKHYNVSVDYLLALTDDPTPKEVSLEDSVKDLIMAARQLPRRRQRDLMAMARTFLETNEQDEEALARDLLDLVRHAGGDASRDQLLNLLEQLDGADGMPGEDDAEVPSEHDR